jgi:hypothetical protein
MINDRYDGASTFVETNHLFKDHTSEIIEERNDQSSSKPRHTLLAQSLLEVNIYHHVVSAPCL